jgi:hypothetical protein
MHPTSLADRRARVGEAPARRADASLAPRAHPVTPAEIESA